MKVKNVVQKLQTDKLPPSKITKEKEDGEQVVDNNIINGDTFIGVTKKTISGVKKFDNQAATKEQLRERLRDAATNGDIEGIKKCLQQGADINAKDNYGYTPLHVVFTPEDGHVKAIKAIKVLVKQGADIDAKDNQGYTPLHMAAVNGYADAIKLLVDLGADVNAKTNSGNTPLELAVSAGKWKAIGMLRTYRTHGWLIAKS